MNSISQFFTLFSLLCSLFSQIGGDKRYSTGTGSYTDETIDDSFGRGLVVFQEKVIQRDNTDYFWHIQSRDKLHTDFASVFIILTWWYTLS